jgi:hypothetical protein
MLRRIGSGKRLISPLVDDIVRHRLRLGGGLARRALLTSRRPCIGLRISIGAPVSVVLVGDRGALFGHVARVPTRQLFPSDPQRAGRAPKSVSTGSLRYTTTPVWTGPSGRWPAPVGRMPTTIPTPPSRAGAGPHAGPTGKETLWRPAQGADADIVPIASGPVTSDNCSAFDPRAGLLGVGSCSEGETTARWLFGAWHPGG